MKRIINLTCVLIIILFTLTGCYNYVDIDKYFYIIALGLDKAENNLLKVSIQTADVSASSQSGSSSSSQSSSYNIYTVEAETIDSAITILNNYLSKKINLSHCSALVISEEIAREGIREYFTTLSNNTELRHSCELLISSTTAFDVLDKVANSGEVFSSRLYDYLTTSTNYTAYTVESTFGYFFSDLQNHQRDPIAIYSKVDSDTIQNSGSAVFRDDVMVGNLTVLDTLSHLMVINELNSCIIDIPSPIESNEKIDLEIKLYKNTEIQVDIINNAPFITISVYPEGSIRSSGGSYNYTSNETIEEIEQAANIYISNLLNRYLYKISKDYNSDIVGFAGSFAYKLSTQEDFFKLHWEEIFPDSFFKVNVKTEINSSNLFNKQ